MSRVAISSVTIVAKAGTTEMLRFILQAVVTALGLWLAAWLVPGVEFT